MKLLARELGRPPLVCGLAGTSCVGGLSIETGIGGGDIVMLGDSVVYCDFGLAFPLFEPFENSFSPAGSVETGR